MVKEVRSQAGPPAPSPDMPLVDGDSPPSVTALADLGRNAEEKPGGFSEATQVIGELGRMSRMFEGLDVEFVVGGMYDDDKVLVLERATEST